MDKSRGNRVCHDARRVVHAHLICRLVKCLASDATTLWLAQIHRFRLDQPRQPAVLEAPKLSQIFPSQQVARKAQLHMR